MLAGRTAKTQCLSRARARQLTKTVSAWNDNPVDLERVMHHYAALLTYECMRPTWIGAEIRLGVDYRYRT